MADYGPTLEVGDFLEDVDGDPEENEEEPWGRLFPVRKGISPLDLVRDEYTFGRSDECDYCFETSGGRTNPHFKTFSNVHFKIYRELSKSDHSKYVVFIKDMSSNGTFVRDEKIGKGKTSVLNNDNEIALSLKKNKVFIFNDRGTPSDNQDIPEAFREKYTLSKFLGRGACGEVKLAFEKMTCEKFAVKIISKKTFSVGPQLGRAAMEEVKILKSLSHPCIIHIEDLYESANALYIVLELVEGGELFDRVVRVGKFSEATAKLLFYQMCMAVKYLHDRGITHRDLKPENVLLSSDENETLLKVTDFGLSKFVGENSLMKTLCGTPSYLAPEVIKSAGLGGYNNACDCWSLGVILFIMLGGYPPFSDEIKEYTLQDQICQGRHTFPHDYWKDVSENAIELIKGLLTVDSKKRMSTTDALQHAWMQDQDVIDKAMKLMNEAANKYRMPMPLIPRRKRSYQGEDDDDSDRKRLSVDTISTPSPTGNSNGQLSSSGPHECCTTDSNATFESIRGFNTSSNVSTSPGSTSPGITPS